MLCYKIILDCKEENVAFYAKSGLTKKEVQMVRHECE
jgi:glucosamine-phosphate N-acetyltransferase